MSAQVHELFPDEPDKREAHVKKPQKKYERTKAEVMFGLPSLEWEIDQREAEKTRQEREWAWQRASKGLADEKWIEVRWIRRPDREWTKREEKQIKQLTAMMKSAHEKRVPLCDPVYLMENPPYSCIESRVESRYFVVAGPLRVEAAHRLQDILRRKRPKRWLRSPVRIPARVYTEPDAASVAQGGRSEFRQSEIDYIRTTDGLNRETELWTVRAGIIGLIRQDLIHRKYREIHAEAAAAGMDLTREECDSAWEQAVKSASLRVLKRMVNYSTTEIMHCVRFHSQVGQNLASSRLLPKTIEGIRAARKGDLIGLLEKDVPECRAMPFAARSRIWDEVEQTLRRGEPYESVDAVIAALVSATQEARYALRIDERPEARDVSVEERAGKTVISIRHGVVPSEVQRTEVLGALQKCGALPESSYVVAGKDDSTLSEGVGDCKHVYSGELQGAELTAWVVDELRRILPEDLPAVAIAAIRAAGQGASLTDAAKAEVRDALGEYGIFRENDPIPEVELVGADLTAKVQDDLRRIPSEDLPAVALAAIRAAGRGPAVRIRDLREIAWESILMLLRAVRNLGARGVR